MADKGVWETSPAALIGRKVSDKSEYDPKIAARWRSAAGVPAKDIEAHYKAQAKAIEQSKTVGNNPMQTAGSRQGHSFHKTKYRPGHRIGKR